MAILNNIAHTQTLLLKEQVAYADGQVISKTLVQNKGLGITLFAFAKGEGVSTHESKGDALVKARASSRSTTPSTTLKREKVSLCPHGIHTPSTHQRTAASRCFLS